MENICKTCYLDSSSHSCHLINNTLYTCPAEATKYDDADGNINHYDNILKTVIGEWEYICDCENFSFKHAMAVNTAIGVIKLINSKYYKNLKKINIINSNKFIYLTIKIIWPFLQDELKDKIYIDEIKYSMR